MAERSNAHDSKSCYAGMYTRVQIPFSAPQKEIYHQVYLFLFCIERLAGNLEFSRVHARSGKRISLSLPHDLSSDDALLRSNKIFLCAR